MNAPAHEYDALTVESLVQGVAAANPGQVVVIVTDSYGVEVKTLTAVRRRLSEDEVFALLAGDSVTAADGARMRKAEVAAESDPRGACCERDTVRRHTKVLP